MPTVKFYDRKKRPVFLTFSGEFKPGDPRPSGYCDFAEWCAVQEKSGYRQKYCGRCSKWWYDFEDCCGYAKSKRLTPLQLRQLEAKVRRELNSRKG